MGRARRHVEWLAGKALSRRAEFRSEFVDLDRGIRVGNLEPEERITRILKARLSERHGCGMICDRWGRGVHWQWICWVPEPNKRAKPTSSCHNFASGKFFVAVDREERTFQAGVQIERAPKRPDPGDADGFPVRVERDWDWNVFLRALRGEELPRLLSRLVREGFLIRVGAFESLREFRRGDWDLAGCRRAAGRFSPREWGGFQLFWPMGEEEVKATPGPEIIDAVLAVFDEVAPVLDLCMYSRCLKVGKGAPSP